MITQIIIIFITAFGEKIFQCPGFLRRTIVNRVLTCVELGT